MQRVFAGALTLSLAMLVWTAHAWGGVGIRGADVSGYPTVHFAVVTPQATTQAPLVSENGSSVLGLRARNLGSSSSVVLAVDRSRSMRGRSLTDASAAADAFVARKPHSDRIGVIAFGKTAVALTGFSTSTVDADSALRSIAVDPVQGTALYDAVVLASDQLSAQPAGGRVIILLTDGQDISSHATLEDAISAAHSAGVQIYPIAIAGPGYTPAPLKQLAAATGGAFATAASSASLGSIYRSIAARLARTWDLTYLTAARPGDRISLQVSVPGQGSAADSLTVPAAAGASPTISAPSRLLPTTFYRSGTGTAALALAVGLLLVLALVLLVAARRVSWVRTRLQPHLTATRQKGRRQSRERSGVALTALLRATERAFGNLRHWRALRRLLERADVPLRPAEFAWLSLGGGVVLALALGAVAGSPLAAVVGFAIGASLLWLIVWVKARRRLNAFETQLPDLLLTIAASLKAGHSFRHGIQTVVDEGQAPASDELRRVLTDAQLGRSLDDSLRDMSERVGSKNFEFVITAVTIQRQVGGTLASLFDMVADTVRQRQQFARRIRSLTAMGRMSAYVLVGLPFFLAIAMTMLNRNYMKPLLDTSSGHLMIVLALVMIAIGSMILKKIVSFRG